MISRRTLLAGIVAAPVAAPAIVKAAIAPSAGYTLSIAGDVMIRGDLALNYDEARRSLWHKLDELSAVRPSSLLAECVHEYAECERLGLLVPPPSEPHDAALDSMYERD